MIANQPKRWLLWICLSLLALSIATAAEPRRLTSTEKLKFSPVFCDEGRALIYTELTDPTLYRLQKLTLSDGKIEPLHPESTTSEFEPGWAADGQCYAYLKTRGALSIGITIRDKQGTVLGEIQPEQGFFGYRNPTVAPNKSRVAYSFAETGAQQIYVSRLNGEDRRALTDSNGLNQWPTYSPDGDFIAFGSSRDGNFEIYIMRADGTEARRLTDHPLQDIRPRFSSDGRRIAFTSHRDGNAEIYTLNTDGTNLQRLTNHVERDDYAAWHPDGKHLVMVSERQGSSDLYLWDIAE